MQITQIETFKFENISVECINQVFDLFIIFINFCDVVSKQMIYTKLMNLIEVNNKIFII